jgi:FkbM family methyltransferase
MIIPNHKPIKGIIQVGANDGGEIQSFIQHTNNILCFEPVEEARNSCINKSKSYPNFNIIVSDYVISDQTGKVEFYIGQAHGNSSMFDLNPERPAFHHWNKHDKKVEMNSITLDDFFEQNTDMQVDNYNYLYMDVQGAEHLVLQGAPKVLGNIDFIWMEVSYFEIYFNTMLFEDMTKYCDSLGYNLYYHQPSSANQNQGDALYIKKSLL